MTAGALGVCQRRSHNQSDRTLERADAVEAEGYGVGNQGRDLHDRSLIRSAPVASQLRGENPQDDVNQIEPPSVFGI